MSTYVIGDVQGCWQALQRLLDKIKFNPDHDQLWFLGDLVNRGPDSLAVLDFVYSQENVATVLGNHDLHFLAVYYGHQAQNSDDTLTALLESPNCHQYAEWLCQQPLLHIEKQFQTVLTHAGIPPNWTLPQAQGYAHEVEAILQSDQRDELFQHMYSDRPSVWHDDLSGWARHRLIINYFTRMRFIDENNHLNLSFKGEIADAPVNLTPWFNAPRQTPINETIVFGHWAALKGHCNATTVRAEALDGGCVWGGKLFALRLEDWQRFSA